MKSTPRPTQTISIHLVLLNPLQKCVLYWPEKRGIYGKVEVLVISVNECDNYTVRNLVLKVRACRYSWLRRG